MRFRYSLPYVFRFAFASAADILGLGAPITPAARAAASIFLRLIFAYASLLAFSAAVRSLYFFCGIVLTSFITHNSALAEIVALNYETADAVSTISFIL